MTRHTRCIRCHQWDTDCECAARELQADPDKARLEFADLREERRADEDELADWAADWTGEE